MAEPPQSAYFTSHLCPLLAGRGRLSCILEVMLVKGRPISADTLLGVHPENKAPWGAKGKASRATPGLAVQSGAGLPRAGCARPGPGSGGEGSTMSRL